MVLHHSNVLAKKKMIIQIKVLLPNGVFFGFHKMNEKQFPSKTLSEALRRTLRTSQKIEEITLIQAQGLL